MHARQPVPPQLLALAACQGGVVSREQALAMISPQVLRRLVSEGRWRTLCPSIYLTQDAEPGWTARAWAGILLGGDRARLGDRAAAHLWGLEAEAPDLISVWVPHISVRARRDGWLFRRDRPGVRDLRTYGDPPRLGITDTVLDLCDAVTERVATDLVLRAVQSRRIRPEALWDGLDRRRRVRHRRLLTELLTVAEIGAETPLELRYLRDVERAHHLPVGIRQARSARSPYVQDVRYEQFSLVVELDGRLGHTGMGRFRDMDRDNVAALADHRSLRYGWPDVAHLPCRVTAQVCTLLIRQGWSGLPRRCRHCENVPDRDWWV